MPYISIAIAAQLLGSQKLPEALPEPSQDSCVLVRRDDQLGADSALSVWMPIISDGEGKMLSGANLRRLADSVERVIATEEPTFLVDSFRGGRPRALGHDGGVAGDLSAEPGLDIGFAVFASSSLPPDLQLQLFDAVESVEHYFENTVRNAVIGPGGEPQDVTLRLALRVQALSPGVPGASRVRTVSVPMSEVTRKLASPVFGNDGDDLVESPVVGPDGDSFEPTVPSYLDVDGNPVGIGSMRVRYSAPSSAPSGENRVFLTRAQYLALGFGVGASGPVTQQYDGTILINSGFQWDYDPSDGASLGQVTRFSFQDYLVREILIQLGWISGIDFLQRDLTILDMYRFSSLASTWEVSTGNSTIVDELNENEPAPPITGLLGSAWQANILLTGDYASGNTPANFPMDYNPGVNSTLLEKGQQLIDGGTAGLDLDAFGNLISNEVAAVPFSGEPPSATSAAHVSLISQLSGLSVPTPQPTAPGRPTVRDSNNRFDDGDWPASPGPERTRYPDGAVPTVVGWPAPPRAQWNFNAPATLAVAGSNNIVAASTAFAGAQLGLVGGLTVEDCDTVSRAPSLLPIAFLPSSDTTRGDNRCLRVFRDWVKDAGIEIRCSTVGAEAPSVRFDMMLSESASSTWLFQYALNGTDFASNGLPNDGYIRIATPDSYQCGIRFDLLIPSFTSGPATRFRLTAVPPPGADGMQSVSEAAGGSVPFSSNGTVEFDMITVSPTVGAQLLVDFNQSFRGHMPRLVARGARAHLNFAMAPNALRSTEDTELFMGTGNSFNNARASFMTQTSASIPPWQRFLMGQSSTAASTTIPRGITFWTRDPIAYAGGPTSKAWKPLGNLPDFLSEQELLVLDHLGWDITGFTTSEYVPEPGLWADLVGEQLHPPQPAYDPTGSARP